MECHIKFYKCTYIVHISNKMKNCKWLSILIALDVLNQILGYVLGLSISFKMVGSDIWCSFSFLFFLFFFFWYCFVFCLFVFFSGRLKCELTRFFQLVFFVLSVNHGGACAVCNNFLHVIPDYHACNTTYTIICNPWTAWQSDRATKIIVTLLLNDGFEKKKGKFLLKLFIPSFKI